MRKIIFSICMVLTALLLIFVGGCKQSDEVAIGGFIYRRIALPGSDASGNIMQGERSVYKRANAKEKLTITFNGQEYTGNYSYSSKSVFLPYEIDTYKFAEEGQFQTNASTNEVVYLLSAQLKDGDLTLEQARTKAKAIADDYVNTEHFVLTEKEVGRFYSFNWRREAQGVQTSEWISISINKDGSLASFSYAAPGGRFDDYSQSDFNSLISEEVREQAIKFSELDGNVKVESITFAFAENEKLCAVYLISSTKKGEAVDIDSQSENTAYIAEKSSVYVQVSQN